MLAPLPRRLAFWRRLTLAAVPAGNALVLLALVLWRWPEWWREIVAERSALTWFSAYQLLACSLICLFIALLRGLSPRSAPARPGDAWLWPVLSSAFAFLCLDESFEIHEKLRDRVLLPAGAELPGIYPGDIVLPLYALAGLIVAARLWGVLAPGARLLFGVGAGVASGAVIVDAASIFPHGERTIQFVEELLEMGAQACFLTALVAQLWEHAAVLVPAGARKA